jgi:uncharacterized membrane protein
MNDRKNQDAAEAPIFSAVLTPHRSLGPGGFVLVMTALGLSSFAAGLAFWLMGAWPVMGFMGLDVALVYGAFRLSYRSARAFEEVELTRNTLLVRKVDAKGRKREFRFHPYWARLEIERSDESVVGLRIASHGRRLALGRFLGPADRESFAAALGDALRVARGGER